MDTEIPTNTPKTGDVFADKYVIESVLGIGGMGVVLAAKHMQLGERVAIKLMLPGAVTEENVGRFLREARAAIRIKSPHCVRVLDVAELANRTPYMVMEYLEGNDLSGILKERGPLPPHVAVDWTLQACEAIAEAHALQIVHRDLKPSNLFLQRVSTGHELVKVLDFGISKAGPSAEGEMVMTRTSVMMGSPLYMSPEQLISSKHVDARSDIWALGVILFELVTGAPPFNAETLPQLGALVLSGSAPLLHTRNANAPLELSQVVATCLQKSADDRFGNLADFATALAPLGTANARASAERIVQILGMPQRRASLVLLNAPSLLAASVVTTGGGWGSVTPAEAAPLAVEPNRRPRSIAPFLAAPLVLVAVAGGGFLGFKNYQDARRAPVGLATPSASTATTTSAAPNVPAISTAEPSALPLAAPSTSPRSTVGPSAAGTTKKAVAQASTVASSRPPAAAVNAPTTIVATAMSAQPVPIPKPKSDHAQSSKE